MREVPLPSGATLKVSMAPFKDAKALFQALAREWKSADPMTLTNPAGQTQLFMAAFASTEVEKMLWPCLSRSLYNNAKIVPETFEPEESRPDFIPVCLEVVTENVTPFMKSLFSGSATPNPEVSGSPR